MWPRRATTWTAPPEGGEPSAEDDQTVVLRAMVDRRAFAPLYEKYLTAVYRRCARHLRDADEAWDATGVTFHKALAALDGFQGGSFEGWLYRIADNACADVHRARRPQVSLDEEIDRPVAGPDPEEQAIAALDRERLEEALRKLPPRRERIVRLHLAGLKGKEIASRQGVSHDVVRQEQRRALVQLVDLLGVDQERREGRDG
jgi:RNA polymerase sigma factor (sigma-70 family)